MEIGYGRCSWRLFSSSIQSSGTECACTLTAKDAAKTISQRPRILQKTNAPARSNVLAQCIDWGARSKIDANIGTENNQPKRSQQSARIVSSTSPMQRLKLTESRERVGCVKFGIGGLLDPGERSADSWNSREVHFDQGGVGIIIPDRGPVGWLGPQAAKKKLEPQIFGPKTA